MSTAKDLATCIYDDLKAKILSLELAPGDPISENDVCAAYDASRTPVRTALHRLSDQRLIDLLPYQQSRISLIDLESVKQFIYARVAIEERVLRDFIALDRPMLVEDVDHLIRKQRIVLSDPCFVHQNFYALDTAMHEIFYKEVGKEDLWKLFQSASDYTRVRMLDIKEERDFEAIVRDHEQLLVIIKDKDLSSIYDVVSRHLNGGVERIESRMTDKVRNYFKKGA